MKVGILTHFYHSLNYGGMLQAYALTEFLNRNNFDAEQICYIMSTDSFLSVQETKSPDITREKVPFPLKLVKRVYRSLKYRLVDKKCEEYYWRYRKNEIEKRSESFTEFQKLVPHSKKIYDGSSIAEAVDMYDCFITGSDQVWNFTWFNPAFFLDFPGSTTRIAYAASAGKSKFCTEEENYLKQTLSKLDAISVREEDLVPTLNILLEKDSIIQTVDPTLLLSVEEWDEITSQRLIGRKYVFCYFLHNDKSLSQLARRFARERKIALATIPFSDIEYNKQDVAFGKYRMDNVGPSEFISLIKHAEYVLTDSFHATVFSLIYCKQFIVFPRGNAKGMESRLMSLLQIFECSERFCNVDEKMRYEYVSSLPDYEYKSYYSKFEKLRQESESFLFKSLKNV